MISSRTLINYGFELATLYFRDKLGSACDSTPGQLNYAINDFQANFFTRHMDDKNSLREYIKKFVIHIAIYKIERLLRRKIHREGPGLNCDGRTRMMIAVLRRELPHLRVYLDCILLDGTPHIRPVFRCPENDDYYAIDGGIKKMNRPPSHLDPPEMVFASWYIEKVLGESPFTLQTTLSEEDVFETRNILLEQEHKFKVNLKNILFPGSTFSPIDSKITNTSYGWGRFFGDEGMHISKKIEEETDIPLDNLEPIDRPKKNTMLPGAEIQAFIEDIQTAIAIVPLWSERIKSLVPPMLALAAIFAAFAQSIHDMSEQRVQRDTYESIKIKKTPEFWVTYQETPPHQVREE